MGKNRGTDRDAVDAWVFRSPTKGKKLRVVIPERNVKLDFGQRGASDFTKHKDAARMLRYLRRHAADPWTEQMQFRSRNKCLDPHAECFDEKLHAKAIEDAAKITQSRREHWADIETRGFWSRWLLWSKPSMDDAIKLIEHMFHVRVHLTRPP